MCACRGLVQCKTGSTWFYQHPCMAWMHFKMLQTPQKQSSHLLKSLALLVYCYMANREKLQVRNYKIYKLDIKFINYTMFLDKKLWSFSLPQCLLNFSGTCPTLMCARRRAAGLVGQLDGCRKSKDLMPKIQRFDDWGCMVVKVTSKKTDLQEIKFFRLVGFHERCLKVVWGIGH